ncbi:MAG: T9SS type A sorting domain-containing protein [Cyclobacteriaceae bacterium]
MGVTKRIVVVMAFLIACSAVNAQPSIARKWNEVLLEGIRNDYARPTVHARNLFHISAAMYDAWAIFSATDRPYLIGEEVHGFISSFDGFKGVTETVEELRDKAISYATYRMIEHRFAYSPGVTHVMKQADSLLELMGYDKNFTSLDYSAGSAAALGNYIASQYIDYGIQDGAGEYNGYENEFYVPVNDPINLTNPGNPDMTDPNRWQPISFDVFIDQSGNEIPGSTPSFLGPEWGQAAPFSLKAEHRSVRQRDGHDWTLYHDPGPPPNLDPVNGGASSDLYKWNFSLVAIWSGHLDAALDTEIDISPASLGNLPLASMPLDFADYDQFYAYLEGGDPSSGHVLNPVTNEPYAPQVVRLGDYARVLAEFWADGPDSETPPGHWFTILNYVNDHPDLEKRFGGEGEVLEDLEWDVKGYFILGGAMHDAAVTAWGIKGYYDYVRPVSAIRYMAELGQSSDPGLANYHMGGIPLVEGYIELVGAEDPLVGSSMENLNKIKLKAWRGPDYIGDPDTDVSGVDWVLAENWWPYQRPTFITPPFAGYVSGHSTFSRAAAEVLIRITGDRFFPGGMGEFEIKKDEFLVFEDGPAENITLQWATYQDASDQCSLSRIWGGIHPPADDINGRLIGEKIGNDAFEFALDYFNAPLGAIDERKLKVRIYPNPSKGEFTWAKGPKEPWPVEARLIDSFGKGVKTFSFDNNATSTQRMLMDQPPGLYFLKVEYPDGEQYSLKVFIEK